MQALHLLALEPVAETTADRNSYGFRSQRSTADAREQCFKLLSRRVSAQWILEGDIKGCFDNISHEWLLANITTDRDILRKWLKAGFIYQRKLFPTEAGTPQGGIISPTLANLTLDGLEAILKHHFGVTKEQAAKNKVGLVRYADDFVITGSSQELLERRVKPLVIAFLADRGLVLSEEKTRVTHIDEGFDFLGWNVRKCDGKLLIKPSVRNVRAFMKKIQEVVKVNRQAKTENLIGILNPIIRGWASYHRGTVAKQTFSMVDHWIWWKTWRWACRRHPNKGAGWLKRKYFRTSGSRNWVFWAQADDRRGRIRVQTLVMASDTKIQRHLKIRGEANPFDPDWSDYFESRMGFKTKVDLSGRRTLLRVWQNQEGRCVHCHRMITKASGWHLHHAVRKIDGGSDATSNLRLLHPTCHRQLHNQDNWEAAGSIEMEL